MCFTPPTRIWLALLVMNMIALWSISCQHFSSTRALGLAAFTGGQPELSAIDWNPASLRGTSEWELVSTNFYSPTAADRVLTFQTAGIRKRFRNAHSVAARISPGLSVEFIVPSTFTLVDSTTSFITTFDKKITYAERFAFGYAASITGTLSAGLSLHGIEENVTDTKYSIDTAFVIRSSQVEYSGRRLDFDFGLAWRGNDTWSIGAVAKNLFHITTASLSSEAEQFALDRERYVRAGIAYEGLPSILLALDGDTEKEIRAGAEWKTGPGFTVRGGLYGDGTSALMIDAASLGFGITLDLLNIDLGYLRFFSQTDRKGTASLTRFQETGVTNIEYNPFTSDKLAVTATIRFGGTREPHLRIEDVNLLTEVFAATQASYAMRPIGRVRVRNISGAAVEARASFQVDRLMDAPTQSKPLPIPPGGAEEIPIFAVFNDNLRNVETLTILDGEVLVTSATDETYDDRIQTRVLVRGRNDWNGDVTMLPYFVSPADTAVLGFTRNVLSRERDRLDTLAGHLQVLTKARLLFNAFGRTITYVGDPKLTQDYVQYPSETLSRNAGDCDDLTVLYASLLTSIGIPVAFIDVIPPERTFDSHIYMMFDTGVDAQKAYLVSDNPKRYCIRRNDEGRETVWIPVETTVMPEGFDQAWSIGAEQYLRDTELNPGLERGWVKVLDLDRLQ